jgi:3'-phosphoadenosine 5'-phosphosulfate sulfotransferase (PAPS reductase)/FAD synthetase
MALQRSKKPVVSCSFGIDSIISIYLTRKALKELDREPSDIDIVWNDTKNEFIDVRKYAKELTEKWNLRLIVTSPKKPLKKIIEEHGGVDSSYFFTRKGDRRNGRPLSEKCCGTLKHEPMKRATKEHGWDLIINGLRSDESTQRLRAGLRDGEFFYSIAEWKAFVCRPILWWTEEDVWNYVEQENIPYNDLYHKNLIQKYPDNLEEIINTYKNELIKYEIDIDQLKEQQLQTVTRKQSILLERIGFKIFTPRTGCLACPIPVRFGYMQWLRIYYPKVYDMMVYNLGYGKVLLEMIPDEVKEEIKEFTGIDVTVENAHEYLQEILEVKPCALDEFKQKGGSK